MKAYQTQCPSCKNGNISSYCEAQDRFHGRRVAFQLVRCPMCSLVWLYDPPGREEMDVHYSQQYDQKVAAAGVTSPERWRDRKRGLMEYKQGGAILDLGCSAGSFLKTLDPKDWKLYGIEMSGESAKKARAESGAEIFVGDILDAPFDEYCFDAITCFHVFEHLNRPKDVLLKLRKWLKPGGVCYVLVPNIDSAGARIFGSYWYALEVPRHVFHYSPRSLRVMARQAGLEVVSLTTHREVFIEESTRYIVDDMLLRIGMSRLPLAYAANPGMIFRVIRKGFRLTVLPLLTGLASLAGDGESIHAFFEKKDR